MDFLRKSIRKQFAGYFLEFKLSNNNNTRSTFFHQNFTRNPLATRYRLFLEIEHAAELQKLPK